MLPGTPIEVGSARVVCPIFGPLFAVLCECRPVGPATAVQGMIGGDFPGDSVPGTVPLFSIG